MCRFYDGGVVDDSDDDEDHDTHTLRHLPEV